MLLNKQNILASSILLYLVSYDFLFFHLEDIFDAKLFILKIFFECLILIAFVTYLVYITKFFKFHLSLISLVVVIFCCISYGFFLNEGIVNIAKEFRMFFLPILFGLVFYCARIFGSINIRKLIFSYISISIMLILFGFYEFIVFDGTVDSIWRYDFLLQAKKELKPDYLEHKVIYQVIRDGSIRVSSLFISALDYSFYVAMVGILSFIMIFKLKKIYFIPLFIAVLFSLYIAQVRTGFILLILGILIFFLINSKVKVLYLLSFLVPFIAIIGTLIVMISGSTLNDTSSLGRLVQYYQLINDFTLLGGGMGRYANEFDSFYIYLFLTYGVFSMLFFYFQYWIVIKLIKMNNAISKSFYSGYEIVLVQFMIIFHLVSLYLFAFQNSLGAPTFFLLYFFSFIIISKVNYNLNNKLLYE
jgi:hypothetical protein